MSALAGYHVSKKLSSFLSVRDRTVNLKRASHYRLLDLYCGEGLAAWGYWLSGSFSEIVGVDVADMSNRYSFDFIRADALTLDYEFLSQFDFVHASPPCQGYSKATPATHRGKHVKLIASTHLMLAAAGMPYVIENVEGSGRELRPNIVLNGQSLGLPLDRRRYFHSSSINTSIRMINRRGASHNIHQSASRDEVIRAMGLDVINPHALRRMTKDGMLQGIPPAMTKYISARLLDHKVMIGEW